MKMNGSDNHKWYKTLNGILMFHPSPVFVVPFFIALQSTARSARNFLVGGWIGCIGSNDRKKCFLIVTGNHLMVYCSFCCFSLGTLWRRNFTWLRMIAKFRELMESVISWIFSPFIDRKQNFVVFVFFLASASWGMTLRVTLDIHIQLVSLCKGVYPWWWLSERVQNGIFQRIWICDLVQVVWPTLEFFFFIFIILSFESRKFAIQMN